MFVVLIAILAPTAALAQSGQIKLALLPVGQAGSFFDLTMLPGETRSLAVDIANDGDAALVVRTYAADVYTIINGGFGARLRDEPRGGTTHWLDYSTEVLRLAVGGGIRRTFAVAVPADAGPGEYITSLVLENDEPFSGNGAVALNQVVRQAVAVVVTVPGQRSPGLAIGKANHKVVAGMSVVAVAVENIGNVRLKPLGTFALLDATGTLVTQATIPMDTFYAHTQTSIEVQLAALLLPGTYTVRLTLEDEGQGVRAEEAIPLIVEAQSDSAGAAGGVPGRTAVIQTGPDGRFLLAALGFVFAGGVLFGLVYGVVRLRAQRANRPTRTSERGAH